MTQWFGQGFNQAKVAAELKRAVDDVPFQKLSCIRATLICRKLLIGFSCYCGVEEGKGTADAVPDTDDSAQRVWVGIARSGPVPAGPLA